MSETSKDVGVATAILDRMRTQRLPKAFALQVKVERGERLDDLDIAFLREVFEDAERLKPMVDQHTEYQELYMRALELYRDITEKALQNEKG